MSAWKISHDRVVSLLVRVLIHSPADVVAMVTMLMCSEQSSVDTSLTHSGPRLGLSCTVLLDHRDDRSPSPVEMTTSPAGLTLSNRYNYTCSRDLTCAGFPGQVHQ